MLKSEIRKSILEKRMALPDEIVSSKSQLILDHLINANILDKHHDIFLYIDFRKEVMTRQMIDYLMTLGKKVYLSKIDMKNKSMTLFLFSSYDQLTLSKFGILEPDPDKCTAIDPEIPTLVLAPGVAFDTHGARLGYGGGFYDRYLGNRKKKPLTIGLAFDMQIVESLENNELDYKMDALCTETNLFTCL